MMELQNYKKGSRKQQPVIKNQDLEPWKLHFGSSKFMGKFKQRAKTYKVHFIEKIIIYNLFQYTYGAYNSL